MQTKILKSVNKLFKSPVHPFNLQNEGKKSYAMWQYEQGERTIEFFLKKFDIKEMFEGKTVIDIGCGAGGKSVYYASCGAEKVYGLEILEKYRDEAESLAKSVGMEEKFQFVAGDSAALPFDDNTADTIIVNDAMEHVANPEKTLSEMLRVLKKGGKIYINFPPYHHPFGAHLSDAVYIPWVHLFFSEKTLISAYKDLVGNLPDGAERIRFRISENENGKEYFSYINKMTIHRYKKILKKMKITPNYYSEVPLRGFFAPLTHVPFIKEMFVKMVVCVIEKN